MDDGEALRRLRHTGRTFGVARKLAVVHAQRQGAERPAGRGASLAYGKDSAGKGKATGGEAANGHGCLPSTPLLPTPLLAPARAPR